MIYPPELLTSDHVVSGFDCGEHSLDVWLARKAQKANQLGHSARTYVVCAEDHQVIGYYALASGCIQHCDAPSKVRRNMPDPIPVIILARLAVDLRHKGKKIGPGLLRDALLRATNVASEIGVRAVIVHALNEKARTFYLKYGFYDSPSSEYTMMVTIPEIERELKQ